MHKKIFLQKVYNSLIHRALKQHPVRENAVAESDCWTFSAMSYCCSDPLGSTWKHHIRSLTWTQSDSFYHKEQMPAWGLLLLYAYYLFYVLFYFGNKFSFKPQGYLFKQTHLFHRKLGKVEQKSPFDKLNSLNFSLKHSVGQSCASPPVLRSVEECNCRSFIHCCQQICFLRDDHQC